MDTIFTAHRLNTPTPTYTVLLRTSSAGAVDVSLWLDDEDARDLGEQLLRACVPVTPAPAPEAA